MTETGEYNAADKKRRIVAYKTLRQGGEQDFIFADDLAEIDRIPSLPENMAHGRSKKQRAHAVQRRGDAFFLLSGLEPVEFLPDPEDFFVGNLSNDAFAESRVLQERR